MAVLLARIGFNADPDTVFKINADSDPAFKVKTDPGFLILMTKNFRILQLEKNQKLQFIYPLASMKDVQATEESFST